jgi:hypothetical protein
MTSCKQVGKTEEEVSKKEDSNVFKMYQMSEMAALMEQMYVDNMRIKNAILDKETNMGDFPEVHKRIFVAKLTDQTDRDVFFETEAQKFITIEEKFYKSKEEDLKANFNEIVNSCIACHEKKCGGPIVRIKKLYIP